MREEKTMRDVYIYTHTKYEIRGEHYPHRQKRNWRVQRDGQTAKVWIVT